VLQEKLMIWCKAQRFAALEQAVVPAGPINTVEEALADPQIVARGLQIAPEGMPGLR
jgi:crotonobetainyl-CoA:carnitine CoA-transferase CaiB-like acyl-CoA transferase